MHPDHPHHIPRTFFSTEESAQLDRRTWRCIAMSLAVGVICSVLMLALAI